MWDDEILLLRMTRVAIWGIAGLLLWAALVMASRLPMFDLHEIDIFGAQHVTMNQAQLVIRQHVRGNFFSVDLAAVRTVFIKLPWVRDASVRRRWPDGLAVTLEEHQPLTRWNDDALLNRNGEIFKAASNLNLPRLSGPTGSELEVLQMWRDFSRIVAPIHHYPVSVTLNDRRSWSLLLDNGMTVELGRDQVAWRLARWVNLYPAMLAQLDTPVTAVDLRYPQGFAVRLLGFKPNDQMHAGHLGQEQENSL